MLLVVRILLLLSLFGAGSAEARDLRILVIGNRIAANCNAHPFSETPGVYQIARDGGIKPARDPLEWAECAGGSIWIPLGNQLVTSGYARTVTFMSIALAEAPINSWLEDTSAALRLAEALRTAKSANLRFDYAFVEHGASAGDDPGTYLINLNKIIKVVSRNVTINKWLISTGSGCDRPTPTGVDEARKRYLNPIYRRFSGADGNHLERIHFSGECSLSERGQLEIASRWAQSIRTADVKSKSYDKESLLYYFR